MHPYYLKSVNFICEDCKKNDKKKCANQKVCLECRMKRDKVRSRQHYQNKVTKKLA